MAGAPTIVIGFSGEVTIRNAEKTAERLKKALVESDRVEIDFTEIAEVDFSFIQLLLSAQKTASAQGKILTSSAPAGGALLEVLDICGVKDPPGRNFWFHEEVA